MQSDTLLTYHRMMLCIYHPDLILSNYQRRMRENRVTYKPLYVLCTQTERVKEAIRNTSFLTDKYQHKSFERSTDLDLCAIINDNQNESR